MITLKRSATGFWWPPQAKSCLKLLKLKLAMIWFLISLLLLHGIWPIAEIVDNRGDGVTTATTTATTAKIPKIKQQHDTTHGNLVVAVNNEHEDNRSMTMKKTTTTTTTTTTTAIQKEKYEKEITDDGGNGGIKKVPRCAINFFGLPRAFKSVVLPSIVTNVIIPNAKYGCDYYVHYYYQKSESKGRSGLGGTINPDDIHLLREQVAQVTKQQELNGGGRMPITVFTKDTEDEFFEKNNSTIDKVRHTKDKDGRYVYFPWKDSTYRYPVTTDNIIKMWHSIQSAWNLMEGTAKEQGFEYERVAVMRSDVVYVTPIDIFDRGDGQLDTENKYAVVPGFGRYPICDRLVYGPAAAVKIWATQRFDRLDDYIQWVQTDKKMEGRGIHSELFVNHALFPAMQKELNIGAQLVEHKTMCFFRARADESVWIKDCRNALSSVTESLGKDYKRAVENALGRECGKVFNARKLNGLPVLDCSLKRG